MICQCVCRGESNVMPQQKLLHANEKNSDHKTDDPGLS